MFSDLSVSGFVDDGDALRAAFPNQPGQVQFVVRRPWWALWRRHSVFTACARVVGVDESGEGFAVRFEGTGTPEVFRPRSLRRFLRDR